MKFVPELMEIEGYSSVFQMVSTVRGQLRGDRDRVDLIRAAFPPGSMTGAPKLASIALLETLDADADGTINYQFMHAISLPLNPLAGVETKRFL